MSKASELELAGGAVALHGGHVPLRGRTQPRVGLQAALASAIVLGNGTAIVWLWLRGGGITAVHGRAEGFTSLGRITGLLGVYLALLQVLMLARVPLLERLIGFDRLTVWHKLNGKACISLIVAHALLITAGYSLAEKISFGREFSRLLDHYPQMVTATIGTGVMIAVVLSSIAIARRRLRYESWYLIHISIYAGIALGYLHQLPTGNEFAVHPAQADYWISLYVATLAILLVYRVALPIRNARRYQLRVESVNVEVRGVTSIEVSGRGLERMRVEPGQFMLWRFLTKGRWWQSHPFSVSAVPESNRLRLTVKGVGDFSRGMGELQPGTRVFAEGPFGVFTSATRRMPSVALIAGGIGITPLRALFDELAGSTNVTLVYRAVSQREVIFEDELAEIARRPGARFELVLGDHRTRAGADALSAKRLRRLLPDVEQRDVYVCGPGPMLDATIEALSELGVHEDQIHTERFALAA
ncbi:MAG: ferredoxin reductase family protein [Solirubrobacteraceae bacterium]